MLETYPSVFSLGYVPTSPCAAFEFTAKAGFSVPGETLAGMAESGLSLPEDLTADAFWEMIIERYSERHTEQYSLHNTLSDSVAVFACGPAPVTIRIGGRLLRADHNDHRLNFLMIYMNCMRARRRVEATRQLRFFLKGRAFDLIIKSLAFTESADSETYTQMDVEGWACSYPSASSQSYAGSEAAVPTCREPKTGEPPKNAAPSQAPAYEDDVRLVTV